MPAHGAMACFWNKALDECVTRFIKYVCLTNKITDKKKKNLIFEAIAI